MAGFPKWIAVVGTLVCVGIGAALVFDLPLHVLKVLIFAWALVMSFLNVAVSKNFRAHTMEVIGQANDIIAAYQADGYMLTLRQLYYQFVARDLIANTQKSYNRLGTAINDGRLAGLIDWEAIEDRTRNLESLPTWSDPNSIVRACAQSFRADKWARQPVRIEVWIEKEALAGVFERVCEDLEVPFFCCRGYTSQSEMWSASQRLIDYYHSDQEIHLLHFGDHDPSGIDMTRDILDRLELFGCPLTMQRLALNMDQVEEHEGQVPSCV